VGKRVGRTLKNEGKAKEAKNPTRTPQKESQQAGHCPNAESGKVLRKGRASLEI